VTSTLLPFFGCNYDWKNESLIKPKKKQKKHKKKKNHKKECVFS
jgi:hypothetical protein